MKKGKLTKIADHMFEGNHPNGIYEGYTSEGIVWQYPEVGDSCVVHDLSTSMVTEILSEREDKITFKTINSTYVLDLYDTIS